jgi:hypothetical protein
LVGIGALFLPALDPVPLSTGAYVQDVGTDRAAVVLVDAEARVLSLLVRDEAGALVHASPPSRGRRHEFAVRGLTPRSSYVFDVVDGGGARIDSGSFRTFADRDDAAVRFSFFGDSGEQPWWVWLQEAPFHRVCAALADLGPAAPPHRVASAVLAVDPDFWLHLGDVVYPWGRREHYRSGFFQPFREVLRRSPCFAVLGNHDVMTDYGEPFLAAFVLPENDVTGDERCWTIRHGPLRVIGLDLNRTVDSDDPAITYLRSVLDAASEPWIVVAEHYPVRSVYREARPRIDLEQHLVPLLETYAVDLLLVGHDHLYQRFGRSGETIQVGSGGGGKHLYEIVRRPADLVTASTAHHFCTVDIDGARLRCRALAVDGRVLDEFEIDKGALARADRLRVDPHSPRGQRIAALVR